MRRPPGKQPALVLIMLTAVLLLAGTQARADDAAQQVADCALLMAVIAGRADLVDYALEHGASADAHTPDERAEAPLTAGASPDGPGARAASPVAAAAGARAALGRLLGSASGPLNSTCHPA